MHRPSLRLFVASIFVLIQSLTPSAFAQQATSEMPSITIRANTRLVVVDVVVTDKKGQPVTGLKADDFTLEENGKKQKISVFAAPGAANRPKQESAPPGILSNHPEHVGPSGVPTILLLDAVNSPFKDQAYGRLQMLKYVVEQGQSGHPMAVLTLTDQLRVLQQFTSDQQLLIAAIKSLRPQEPLLQSAPPPPEPRVATMLDTRANSSSAALAAVTVAVQQFEDVSAAYNLERRTLITIDALKALSRLLGGLPGRKNVVWLTASLPFDLIPENRNMSDEELAMALPNQGNQPVNLRASAAGAAEQRQLYGQQIKEAESQLASANVAVYPVDLQGLVGGMEGSAAYRGSAFNETALSDRALSQAADAQDARGTMEEVASHTGGKAYVNQNEIKNGIALAVSDDKATYTLAYYPDNKKWDGKFRGLKVKLDQGDTQLRYRKGYFGLDTEQTKSANPEQDVANTLAIGAPATQISFMAQAKPTDPGKMRVVFLVDAHTLTADDAAGGRKINASLYAVVCDAAGKSLGSRSTKVDRTFDAATYQQILDKGMMVPIDMEMPAGAQRLRLAVLDNKTGFIGTASGPLGQ